MKVSSKGKIALFAILLVIAGYFVFKNSKNCSFGKSTTDSTKLVVTPTPTVDSVETTEKAEKTIVEPKHVKHEKAKKAQPKVKTAKVQNKNVEPKENGARTNLIVE